MRVAKSPFEFYAASYLVQIRSEKARTLADLARFLRSVSEASIFFHTFQSLEAHHYTTYSSDFAQWAIGSLNEPILAESLGSIDVRDFVSITDLRQTIVESVDGALKDNPAAAERLAFEPFYFCEAAEVVVPLDQSANTLADLAAGIQGMSLQTLHYHFISSRLRLQSLTNDFSNWISESLGFPDLAASLNRLDFYTHTLEQVRMGILHRLEPWMTQ